jgi:hypothetical protein
MIDIQDEYGISITQLNYLEKRMEASKQFGDWLTSKSEHLFMAQCLAVVFNRLNFKQDTRKLK